VRIPIYQVDAFTSRVFGGNPAAVCPLEAWLPDATLQAIAAENNLSETAFFVGRGGRYEIRWFTPAQEVDLCGHATLASAHVVLSRLAPGLQEVEFSSKSGPLRVTREGRLLALDFPTRAPARCPAPAGLAEALGRPPRETWASRDLLCLYEDEAAVRALRPDVDALGRLDAFAVIVTAPGDDVDFVSRFFAPKAGVPEDPVTGSAHCTLIPFWAERLGKRALTARQVSRRGGELRCELRGERVSIAGEAADYLEGTIDV
jgi:PhzF family phenazine biosynthesis protein